MDELEFESFLSDLLCNDDNIKRVTTFDDRGYLTRDNGLFVEFKNGDTFDITIQETRK